jgi:hypothetical protein
VPPLAAERWNNLHPGIVIGLYAAPRRTQPSQAALATALAFVERETPLQQA